MEYIWKSIVLNVILMRMMRMYSHGLDIAPLRELCRRVPKTLKRKDRLRLSKRSDGQIVRVTVGYPDVMLPNTLT